MSNKKFLINAFDLLVLSCLAIAQPIFDLLGRNAEFLAARKSNATEVLILIIAAIFLIPVLLSILELVARMIGPRTCNCVHRVFLWAFVVLLFLPLMKPVYRVSGIWPYFILLVIAAIISEFYARLRSRGLALAYLSPIILILPGLFVFNSPVHKIVWPGSRPENRYPKVKATAPIVMVVLDELPLTSLMNDNGRINSLRYPNFAKLADSATWYRNASSVAASTLHSVPAILDGQLPDLDRKSLPLAKDHPETLFTLLGGSYRMNVVETNTSLCPEDLCGSGSLSSSRSQNLASLFSDVGILYLYILLPADWTGPLPSITQSWKEFSTSKVLIQAKNTDDFFRMISWDDRSEIFARFVESIRPSSAPTLHFLHIMLPHPPWQYLPSGKKHTLYEKGIRGLIGVNDQGTDTQQWLDDPWAIQQAYKKHLLQVEMVDGLIGKLVRHLEEVNLFEPSLIVITADHGNCFQPRASRRLPSRAEYSDLMSIPLFIKSPNQQKGIVDDSNIETIDILPTMADILGIKMPWRIDGRSILNPSVPGKKKKTIIGEDGTRMVVKEDFSDISESVKQMHAIFGYSPDELFRIGPYTELINRNIKDLVVTRSAVKCILEGRAYLDSVDLNSHFIPANIKGRLIQDSPRLALPLNVAISLNGKIGGITEAYRNDKGTIEFSLILPEGDFRSGYNQVGIYLVTRTGDHLELRETVNAELPSYQWGDVLSFGSAGNAKFYQTEGWSEPEETITWTNGKKAELVLPTSVPRRPICLRLFTGTYLSPGIIDKQRVKLYVNHQPVADWISTSREFKVWEATIPQETFNSNRTVLTIELPDSAAPASIGDGSDARALGLAVSSLSLSER